ncbi:uncharacterized protein TNIN_150281 [Trichonephila inaurata madagascariensis]|uniref:Uncharacterized protein n=1 Tax=Trichonephila inaurata madagascariensis TaxID=2747483 RepID=A0A8X7BZC2_9ARAC|nr:uncharacterized protein TNIN_150281 [Trichonephila inaurata madagascariensis]
MRRESEQKFEDSTLFGCGAHWLNFLGQNLTPSSIMKHVVDIDKYFRNHHAPGKWLKECSECVSPQLLGCTRWGCQLTCLETFIQNHTSYVKRQMSIVRRCIEIYCSSYTEF